jgi:methionine-rich copper-binding protein CopC
VVVTVTPRAAWAHARLVRMVPTDGAELSLAPKTIDLWFSEILDTGFNSIAVFPAAELSTPNPETRATGPAEVDRKERTHLSCPVGPLGPGEWVVQWRVLSRDGHAARGRTTFEVRAAR